MCQCGLPGDCPLVGDLHPMQVSKSANNMCGRGRHSNCRARCTLAIATELEPLRSLSALMASVMMSRNGGCAASRHQA